MTVRQGGYIHVNPFKRPLTKSLNLCHKASSVITTSAFSLYLNPVKHPCLRMYSAYSFGFEQEHSFGTCFVEETMWCDGPEMARIFLLLIQENMAMLGQINLCISVLRPWSPEFYNTQSQKTSAVLMWHHPVPGLTLEALPYVNFKQALWMHYGSLITVSFSATMSEPNPTQPIQLCYRDRYGSNFHKSFVLSNTASYLFKLSGTS